MNNNAKKTKSEVIRSRVTKQFKSSIKEYARLNNLTVSETIERALIELMKK
jgi:ribosomal protein L30E